jgi:hypothetical protein
MVDFALRLDPSIFPPLTELKVQIVATIAISSFRAQRRPERATIQQTCQPNAAPAARLRPSGNQNPATSGVVSNASSQFRENPVVSSISAYHNVELRISAYGAISMASSALPDLAQRSCLPKGNSFCEKMLPNVQQPFRG